MNKYTFLELQTFFASKRGFTSFSLMASHEQTSAKMLINELYEAIWFHKNWAFSKREGQITTKAPYTTGTISGAHAAGVNTINFSSASLAEHLTGLPLKGQLILLGSYLYRILYVVNGNKLTIEGKTTEALTNGQTYKIYFPYYPFRWDLGVIRDAQENITPIQKDLPWELMSPEVVEGEPTNIFPAGQIDFDMLSGSATFTNLSQAVSSVSVTGGMLESFTGLPCLKQNSLDVYHIIYIPSTTTATLDRTYQSATASGTIVICPKGTPLIGVNPLPDAARLIEFRYTFLPTKLVGDNDYTLLPSDSPMLAGIEVMGTKWETVGERGFINEALFQERKFKESLKILGRRFGVSSNPRLISPQEAQAQRMIIRNSNPWNRG